MKLMLYLLMQFVLVVTVFSGNNVSAQAQIERMTRYWPLVISETIIFNMTSVSNALNAVHFYELYV